MYQHWRNGHGYSRRCLEQGFAVRDLFHEVKSPVMTDENNNQTDNNDCNQFHRTSDYDPAAK